MAEAGNDTTVCAGASVNLMGTGGSIYVWSPATGLSCTNCQNPTATPASTTTYTLTVSGGSCTPVTDSVTITVNPLPVLSITPNITTICSGSSDTLVATGATSYTWSPSTGLNVTTGSTVIANPSLTTTYTLTGTSAGCTSTDSVLVNVTSGIVAEAGADTALCIGDSIILNASGGTSYSWSPAAGLSCTNCANPMASPASTTVYTVAVSSGTCLPAIDSMTITVYALPVAHAGVDDTICSGDSITLSASGGLSYSWSPATGLSCTNCANPQATPTVTTNYIVTAFNANGCAGKDTVVITVLPGITANAGSDDTICLGSNTNLSASGGTTYQWSPAAGLSCTNCQNPVANPITTTTYTVTVSNGICSANDMVTITVNALPVASITGDTLICSGTSTTLTAHGGTTYLWNTAAATQSITVYPSSITSYTVTVSTGGCSSTAGITVTLLPIPIANAGSDTTIHIGTSAQLNGSGGNNYSWSPITDLSCADCPDPIATPSSTTSYILIVTDMNGCTDADTVTVFVDENCGDVFVPNAFSPNGDLENDVLFVRGNCIKNMKLLIYDRWGEKVFESTEKNSGWDGKYQGSPMNPGVFVYELNATMIDGKTIKLHGNITLMK